MTTKATKDYSQGKIYKIEPTVEHDEGDIYIGSTTKKYLSQRMTAHRKDYTRWKDGKKGFASSFNLFDKYGIENCNILLLENVNASNYDELVSRESFYVKTLTCVNINIPFKTEEEHKQVILKQAKEYNEKNKERISIRNKKYHEINKERISIKKKEYRDINKEAMKVYNNDYYQNNKEKILAQYAKYREENRDKINERQRLAYQKKKQEKESLGNV